MVGEYLILAEAPLNFIQFLVHIQRCQGTKGSARDGSF